MSKTDLIPVTHRSKEEAKEISRKGGINSGISRREKRRAREVVQILLDEKVKDAEGKTTTRRELILRGLVSGAEGDLAKAKYLFELAGEAPTQESVSVNVPALHQITLVIDDKNGRG